jgi:ABC-type dipeptide/oligopeptide/nickel transport system permease component
VGWVGEFWFGALSGDMGRSYRGYPVDEMVLRGAGRTLPLIAAAVALSLLVSVGLVYLRRRDSTGGSWIGRALVGLVGAVSPTPVFLLAYLALVLLAVPPEGPGLWAAAIGVLALGDGMLGDMSRGLDAEVRRLLDLDFVHSARLRGFPLWRRLLPHLLLPTAQLVADRGAYLVGGILVLEMVLGIQGLGLIGYRAAQHADFPLLIAITVFITAVVAGMQLGVDLLRVGVDPRVRKDRRLSSRARAEAL